MSLEGPHRLKIESWVRPLYVELDGVDTFDRVVRRHALAMDLLDGDEAADEELLELLLLFHGPGRRLGSTEPRGRWWLFLRGLGFAEPRLRQLSAGLARWQVAPQTVEEEVLHDAVLIEEVGIAACAQRLWQAGRKRVPLTRALAVLDPGPVAERFKTVAGRRLASARHEAAEAWIGELRRGVESETLGVL